MSPGGAPCARRRDVDEEPTRREVDVVDELGRSEDGERLQPGGLEPGCERVWSWSFGGGRQQCFDRRRRREAPPRRRRRARARRGLGGALEVGPVGEPERQPLVVARAREHALHRAVPRPVAAAFEPATGGRREQEVLAAQCRVGLELREVEPPTDTPLVALAQTRGARRGHRPARRPRRATCARAAAARRRRSRCAPRSTTPLRWSARTTAGPTTGPVLPKPESDTYTSPGSAAHRSGRAEPETVHHAGAEVLDEDVGLVGEPTGEVAAHGGPQVEHDALLVDGSSCGGSSASPPRWRSADASGSRRDCGRSTQMTRAPRSASRPRRARARPRTR